jgi:hypothetical protein
MVEHFGKQYGFPTRTELDDVHRTVTELRREIRAMRQQQRTSPPAEPLQMQPSASPPAAKQAAAAKKTPTARKTAAAKPVKVHT